MTGLNSVAQFYVTEICLHFCNAKWPEDDHFCQNM